MKINNVEIPTEVAANLMEFRKAMEAAQKFMAGQTRYVLPEVLRRAN